jgi:hypothetical protein
VTETSSGISIEYSISPRDFREFQLFLVAQTGKRQRLVLYSVGLILAAVAVYLYFTHGDYLYYLTMALLLFLIPQIGKLTLILLGNRAYKVQRLGNKLSANFNNETFSLNTEKSTSEMKWDALEKTYRTKEYFYLMYSRRLGYIIPLNAFASDADRERVWNWAKR